MLLYHYTDMQLCYYATILLFYYTIILYYCPTLLTTMLLYYYTGCWRVWPKRTGFLGDVLAVQSMLKLQITGFSGHFLAPSGLDPKIQEFVASARTAWPKHHPRNPSSSATLASNHSYTTIGLHY